MIEQLDGGRQRVAEMLGKYQTDLDNDNSENESKKEVEDIDLGRYL